jgi:inorganic phosphate transporter, PiT family
LAGVVAVTGTFLVYKITASVRRDVVSRSFKTAQALSASLVSLAHGTNDAQKTMGVITLTLISSGTLAAGSGPPVWVILSAGTAIAASTYFGGWPEHPGHGARRSPRSRRRRASTSSAVTILASSHLGLSPSSP